MSSGSTVSKLSFFRSSPSTNDRIVLADPVIEASRQQRKLPPICLFNEPRHLSPRRFSTRIIASVEFSHSQGRRLLHVLRFQIGTNWRLPRCNYFGPLFWGSSVVRVA